MELFFFIKRKNAISMRVVKQYRKVSRFGQKGPEIRHFSVSPIFLVLQKEHKLSLFRHQTRYLDPVVTEQA